MIQLKSPSAKLIYTFDWANAIADTATLHSVAHSVPEPVVLISEAYDVGQQLSNVEIGGGAHGGLYVIQARATLSTGETVTDGFTLRVFEGV